MESLFSIREAAPEDLAKIVELMREFAEFEKMSDEFFVTVERLREAVFGTDAFVKILVAFAENDLIGYALFYPKFASFRGERGVYLEDLYVRPTMRGKGLGLEMLKTVARFARENDFERLDWQALNWNAPAIRFYRKIGAESNEENIDFRLRGAAFENMCLYNMCL